MAAPVLRHYASEYNRADIGVRYRAATPTVPATRALVVSKATVMVDGASVGLFLWIGPSAGLAIGAEVPATPVSGNIIRNSGLNNGEVYTETGLVIPAGEVLAIYCGGTANQTTFVAVNVFGEEVDN